MQRIEYIRGPRSAVYGSDAIGGVVNIITTRAKDGTTLNAGVGTHGFQNYGGSTQQTLGDSTRVTLAGDYTYTKGFDVVADGNNGGLAQTDRDGFMNKTLYGALEHAFSEQWSGFVRGYGYSNRTAYDGYYSSFTPDVLVDTRQLYSQTWDAGLRFSRDIFHSQLLSSYSHSKDYNYDPHLGRYDSTATWMKSNSTMFSGPTLLTWGMAISARALTGRNRAPSRVPTTSPTPMTCVTPAST